MKLIYDVTFDIIHNQEPSGPMGYMSFRRLAETMRKSGEIAPDEALKHIVVTERGLSLYFERVRTS